ncbi:MAG TPA: hypothetical protein VFA18_05570 [Gemmataceae bacterium]|nr:hypothetical protein [Gemmataceae bacterium]
MRRLYLVGCLFLGGCCNIVGPFESRRPVRVDDPRLTIGEQERMGRSYLPLPVESEAVAPTPQGLERPGTWGVPPP